MDDYKSSQNIAILGTASVKMLKEKFDIILLDDKLQSLLNDIMKAVQDEYSEMGFKCKELNNITLSKIKTMFTTAESNNVQKPNVQNNANNDVLDDDLINVKLRELEARRQIIPTYQDIQQEETRIELPKQAPIQPITFALPSQTQVIDKIYKTFIINSLNRDWDKTPLRNNIKFSVPLSLDTNLFYLDTLCLPTFVRNITPYVIINVSDGNKRIFYTLLPLATSTGCSKWDVWKPIQNAENIVLGHKNWSLKLYDFYNNELDLGADDIQIVEVKKDDKVDNKFTIKLQVDKHSYDNNFTPNDNMILRANNTKLHYNTILHYDKDTGTMTIVDKKNKLKPEDFINSKIMNCNNQFSCIIKYCYKE